MSDNVAEQADEVEALLSIYGRDFSVESEIERCYSITLSKELKLFVTFNDDYPANSSPSYTLLGPCLSKETKEEIYEAFDNIFNTNLGSPVVFQMVEQLREIVNSKSSSESPDDKKKSNEEFATNPKNTLPLKNYDVIHGEVITDRKSSFQGHACVFENIQDIQAILKMLKDNKKIQAATHNIYAYRFVSKKGVLSEYAEDDGENRAGERLLHLLRLMDVKNVLVVVTRWFGGVHIGPDRFKHINNAARQVLLQGNFNLSEAT